MSARQRGMLFVLLAAVLYSTGGLCMKLVPWGGVALNCGRCAIALAVYLIYFWIKGQKPKINRWILLGAAAVCGTNVLFALANKMTTAANSIVLQYTAPIFVILLSALFLHRRATRLDLMACAVVFLGVVCFFVESLGGGRMAGDALALLAGVAYAVVFLLNDMPEGDAVSSVFWGAVMSVAIGLPFLPEQPPLTGAALGSMLFLGAAQTGLAFLCLAIGLKTTPPVAASLISGIEPVLNPVLVAVFYGELMGPLSLLGAAVVVCGVVFYQLMLGRGEKAAQKTPPPSSCKSDNQIMIFENTKEK